MAHASPINARRTSVDDIFALLYDDILSLRLKPGDKISEAEIAARFGVSRQPVRDSFNRLANQGLLVIRPQRATEVKRFSMREIEKSRFIRAAVEKEVLRRAAQQCDETGAVRLEAEIKKQKAAIRRGDFGSFGALDYAFHQTLCEIACTGFAFEVIMAEKSKVDRLCVLGLSKEDRMPQLLDDHHKIAEAVKAHDGDLAVAMGALHLSRLDETINLISKTNANYFDPADY